MLHSLPIAGDGLSKKMLSLWREIEFGSSVERVRTEVIIVVAMSTCEICYYKIFAKNKTSAARYLEFLTKPVYC